jgi:hypothetical protein
VKACIEYLDNFSPDEFDIMDPMPVVMQRTMRDDCHENVKLLINKISELNQENEMKNICLAAIGLISFMLHFNLTIVAFMKSSALYADEKTILWRSVLEYLSIPIAYIDGYLFIDNVIVLIMLNSLIWTCLIVFVIWRLRMFKKT